MFSLREHIHKSPAFRVTCISAMELVRLDVGALVTFHRRLLSRWPPLLHDRSTRFQPLDEETPPAVVPELSKSDDRSSALLAVREARAARKMAGITSEERPRGVDAAFLLAPMLLICAALTFVLVSGHKTMWTMSSPAQAASGLYPAQALTEPVFLGTLGNLWLLNLFGLLPVTGTALCYIVFVHSIEVHLRNVSVRGP